MRDHCGGQGTLRGRSRDDHRTIIGAWRLGGWWLGVWTLEFWRLEAGGREADQAGFHWRLEARSLKAEQAGGWRLEAEGSKGNQGTIIVAIRGRSATINRRSVHDQSGDTKFRAQGGQGRHTEGAGDTGIFIDSRVYCLVVVLIKQEFTTNFVASVSL